jgi:hypothetical protein
MWDILLLEMHVSKLSSAPVPTGKKLQELNARTLVVSSVPLAMWDFILKTMVRLPHVSQMCVHVKTETLRKTRNVKNMKQIYVRNAIQALVFHQQINAQQMCAPVPMGKQSQELLARHIRPRYVRLVQMAFICLARNVRKTCVSVRTEKVQKALGVLLMEKPNVGVVM